MPQQRISGGLSDWVHIIGAACVLLLQLYTPRVAAYPAMQLHGYVSCRTCHHNPQGGGLLNPYGQMVESDFLWRVSNEVPKPEMALPASVGARFRFIQTEVENRAVRVRRAFVMQAETAIAVETDKIALMVTYGKDVGNGSSREIWAAYKPTKWLFFQAGKYAPRVGLGLPDHTLPISQGSSQEKESLGVGLEFGPWSGAFHVTSGKSPAAFLINFAVPGFTAGAGIQSGPKYSAFLQLSPWGWLVAQGEVSIQTSFDFVGKLTLKPWHWLRPYVLTHSGPYVGFGLDVYPFKGISLNLETKCGEGQDVSRALLMLSTQI